MAPVLSKLHIGECLVYGRRVDVHEGWHKHVDGTIQKVITLNFRRLQLGSSLTGRGNEISPRTV